MEKQIKKDKAIELMKALDIYKPYIDDFEQKGRVCLFEIFGGYWVDQMPEIEKKMKEIESEYKVLYGKRSVGERHNDSRA